MKRVRLIIYTSPKVRKRIERIAAMEGASLSNIAEKAVLLGLKELEEIYRVR